MGSQIPTLISYIYTHVLYINCGSLSNALNLHRHLLYRYYAYDPTDTALIVGLEQLQVKAKSELS